MLVVGFESGVLEGYFRRAEEDAADRAALDDEAPIVRRLVCCSMKMIRHRYCLLSRQHCGSEVIDDIVQSDEVCMKF